MAKDRTRHARRREPDSRYEPLFDVFGRETGQAIIDFGKKQWQMAVSFADDIADDIADTVADCAETYRRLTNERD